MSSTITLQSSINWIQAYCGYRGLTIGTSNEPAITSANITLQTVIGPPFSWNWNRDTSINFLALQGIQDYTVAAPTFGFIEKAHYIPASVVTATSLTSNIATYICANSFTTTDVYGKPTLVSVRGATNDAVFNVTNAALLSVSPTQFTVAITHGDIVSAPETTAYVTSGAAFEVSEVINVLGTGNEQGTPNKIAPQIDDNAGNITFRVLPAPDQTYHMRVIQQKRIASLITAVANTWAPIPDHYSFIYQKGFAALMLAYQGDPRWTQFNQQFVASLLGAAEGLSEEQRNIFQQSWLNTVNEQQARGLMTQQGTQGRGAQ